MSDVKIYTKESLSAALIDIRARGWIRNARNGNDGGIGNTLEDILGIQENNLPIPNAAEWELKCQRIKTTSLTTLFNPIGNLMIYSIPLHQNCTIAFT